MRKTAASPQDLDTIAAAHPLTELLVARLASARSGRILEFASGSGRNTRALRRAGFTVVAIGDRTAASDTPLSGLSGRFSAVLSTHGFLHGTADGIKDRLMLIAESLEPGGLLYATFGSTRDARYGEGVQVDDFTFAPTTGDEHGVAHTFFDRERLSVLLHSHFTIDSLEERGVDNVAGSWAHAGRRLSGAIHWFATAATKAK